MSNQNYTTFYFPIVDKLPILEVHKFYVSEAQKRLFSQFSDIEGEAKEIEKNHLEETSKNFDPDWSDPADMVESAFHEGLSHWTALTDMQTTVILAITAGMYHQFDKTLREKIVIELANWLDRDTIGPIVWSLTFEQLVELLEMLDIGVSQQVFFSKLNACRLVVNVYKHGDGVGHQELSAKHPEYYLSTGVQCFDELPPKHNLLNVTRKQFVEFADAITGFWENLPERCTSDQLQSEPKWLDKKIKAQQKKITNHPTKK